MAMLYEYETDENGEITRMTFMEDGKVIFNDSPSELYPRTHEDLVQFKDFYQRRVEWSDGQLDGGMGRVLLPYGDPRSKKPNPSTDAVRLFHLAMTSQGPEGVEYTQEALHQNGNYFEQFFLDEADTFQEAALELGRDIERFKQVDYESE